MNTRKLCLFVLLALFLTACGKADPAVTNSNAPLEAKISESTGAQLPADPAVPQNQGDSIAFRYLYRGFSTISLDDMAAFEAFSGFGTKLILNEEDWSTFMGSYCPGIPYYDTCDFSKECLIASVIQGARPTYANSNTITRLSWGEGYFVFEYDNNPANYIYALNGDNGTHFYVEVRKERTPIGKYYRWGYASSPITSWNYLYEQ